MGRQSANEGFLRSWFRYADHQEYWCMARYRSEAQVFARIGEEVHQSSGKTTPVYRWIAQNQIHRAAPVGTVYLPGPQVADMAWIRHRDPFVRANGFSLVGMTHTSCELPVQDSLADMLTAPVQPWDAQICPSQSVRTMVERLLSDEATWLTEHLGATRVRIPELPVLPLGVNCDQLDISGPERQECRSTWRSRWNLTPQDVCVLYVGRLDLRTKANLYPTLDAIELASRRLALDSDIRLVLVLGGWFASEWDESTLRHAVTESCPSVRVIFEDGRPLEFRRGAWHGADVFTSLVDNIQETFGLTPLEAMSAGLPVVVSDYDGYRESVREGVDGFRIPTSQPPAGGGLDLMDLHADHMITYRDYVGMASAFIGVDLSVAALAFEKLARDPALRIRMGESGRQHVRRNYDWRLLIPKYVNLFRDLAQLRLGTSQPSRPIQGQVSANPTALGARYPRRSDPFHSFEHYSSMTLAAGLRAKPGPVLSKSVSDHASQLALLMARPVYASVEKYLHPAELLTLLAKVVLHPSGMELGTWLSAQPVQAMVQLRQVGWLHKSGLVTLETVPGHQ